MEIQISEFLGKTFTRVIKVENSTSFSFNWPSGEILAFHEQNGDWYFMGHLQDCCETATIEDIAGDVNDLIGSPILKAEESSKLEEKHYGDEEWTFYKLATIKGYVDIRWYSESNGYYSTAINCFKVDEEEFEGHYGITNMEK